MEPEIVFKPIGRNYNIPKKDYTTDRVYFMKNSKGKFCKSMHYDENKNFLKRYISDREVKLTLSEVNKLKTPGTYIHLYCLLSLQFFATLGYMIYD